MRRMAAQMSASAADDLWSNLPGDLVGAIYNKIASPVDRVRFKAVSSSWRATASVQRPAPSFPWLVLPPYEDGTAAHVFCPVDGTLLRVPLPPEAAGKRLVGVHDDGWIASTSAGGGGGDDTLVILNLFSGIDVPLSAKQRATPTIGKLVFSEAPTSKRCILAAIRPKWPQALAVCRVGCRKRGWWMRRGYYNFCDVVFCHGKLYGLNHNLLVIFDTRMTKKGSPVITSTYKIRFEKLLNCTMNYTKWAWVGSTFRCIVNYNDKPLIALRAPWLPYREHIFKVFELVHPDNPCDDEYNWGEVTTLGGNALFLSAICSKAVHVPPTTYGGIERNHIYYNHILRHGKSIYHDNLITSGYGSLCVEVRLTTYDNGGHCLCSKENQEIVARDGIASVDYYVTDGNHAPMWVLPPDF